MLIVPPPESEQRARAVWRDPKLRAWLRDKGLEYAALRTDFVLSYYLADPERLLGTGLTAADDLTVDHVIAYELGGLDSIFNFHLMTRSANSHFGEFYTAEKVHFIGSENAKVAQRVVRLARQQGADRFDASTFSPSTSPWG